MNNHAPYSPNKEPSYKEKRGSSYSNVDVEDSDSKARYILKRRMKKRFEEDDKRSIDEEIEAFLSFVDIDSHSNDWNKFKGSFMNGSKKLKTINESTEKLSDLEISKEPIQIAVPNYTCLVCRRVFASLEKQERHNAESALHSRNLELLSKEVNKNKEEIT